MQIRNILCFGILTLLMTSCQGDTAEIASSDLEGRWEIISAYRDGKETMTLRDGFFEFVNPDQFKTNILGDTSLYAYSVSRDRIVVKTDPIIGYTVLDMLSDTLIMRTEIQKLDFIFVSIKSQQDELQE